VEQREREQRRVRGSGAGVRRRAVGGRWAGGVPKGGACRREGMSCVRLVAQRAGGIPNLVIR
jgi:hypothetical protein